MKTEQKPLHTGLGDTSLPRDIIGNLDLSSKTVLITGGHSGIGLVVTKALAKAGARVIVGARNMDKARRVLSKLQNVTFAYLDLSDPGSIDKFSENVSKSSSKLDILINNAGIMALPVLSRDSRGYELQFSTNHLGHFQLTARLWNLLKQAGSSRVVTLSSYGHRFSGIHFEDIQFDARPYEKWAAYGQSKTANSLFSVELDSRGRQYGIRAFAVHPGRIPATDLKRFMSFRDKIMTSVSRLIPPRDGIRIKNTKEGASTTLWAALSPQLTGIGGVYCADCDVSPLVHEESPLGNSVRDYAVSRDIAAQLWSVSERLTGVTFPI